jgi:hypothetical protein
MIRKRRNAADNVHGCSCFSLRDTKGLDQVHYRSHNAVIRVYDEAGNVRRISTRDSSESGEFTFITPKPIFSHGQFR